MGKTFCRMDLVRRFMEQGYSRSEASKIVNFFVEQVKDALLSGQKVHFRGFGTFEIVKRKGGVARNIKLNQKVEYPPRYKVRFSETKKFRGEIEEVLGIPDDDC